MRIDKFLMARVSEAECIPRGYGLAYWDYERYDGIFYLIPFNLIARFFLSLYWAIARGFYPNWSERKLHSEYKRGWDEAWKNSYEKGLKDGIKDGYTKRQKEIDNFVNIYLGMPQEKRSKWLDEQEANKRLTS